MALTSVDDLVAALPGQILNYLKISVPQQVASSFNSSWTAAGFPGAGATPTSGAGDAPTSSTNGAVPFTNPAGGKASYLARFVVARQQAGYTWLVDRLVQTSGLSGTVTTAQTVNSVTLPARDINGATAGDGVECWLECYTALGATSRTATVSYTNSAGVAGRSGTATIPTSMAAGRMVPVTLQAGDTGVQSVQSITLSGTTGTAGNFGVTLLRRIIETPGSAGGGGPVLDPFQCGLARIYDSSCLSFIFGATNTTVENPLAQIQIIQA